MSSAAGERVTPYSWRVNDVTGHLTGSRSCFSRCLPLHCTCAADHSQAPALVEALAACLLDYPLDDVAGPARNALPKLLRAYLGALSSGALPASEPAASPAAAQALLLRLWQAVTAVLNFEAVAAPASAAEGGAAGAALGPLLALPGGLKRPTPTSATRADMAEVRAGPRCWGM